MKKKVSWLWLLTLGIVLCVSLFAFEQSTSAADDPLKLEGQATPNQLTGPGSVNVSINVLNISDVQTPITVTLEDPNKNTCTAFGSGGTASLGPGQSRSYTGSWQVTQAQLEAGRITYSARYSFQDANGQVVSATKPYSITIKHNVAKPKLDVTRTISPNPPVKGQVVTISYLIKNTGTVDATDIIIKDPSITSSEVVYPLLKVNDQQELSYTYVAEDASKSTAATLSYNYKLGDKIETSTYTMDPKVISIATASVSILLKADKESAAPGDKVNLTAVITNSSDLSYEKIKITDITAGDIDNNVSIAAGATKEFPKEVIMGSTAGKYQFKISGVDNTGTAVTFESNLLTIPVEGGEVITGDPPVLEVTVEADRSEIYEEPAEVVFRINVTNTGTATVKNITLRIAGKDIAKGITLNPGSTFTQTRLFRVSSGGNFQFRAVTKVGNEDFLFDSEPVLISYKKLSEPPAPTIAPTQVPVATPTPETDQQGVIPGTTTQDGGGEPLSVGTILLYGLAVLLVLLVMGAVLLFVLEKRRNRPASTQIPGGHNMVIDSIQRSPHRDYARPPKRTPTKAAKEPKRPAASPPPVADEDLMRAPAEAAPSLLQGEDEYDGGRQDDLLETPSFIPEALQAESGQLDRSAYRRPEPAARKPARDDYLDFDDDEPDDLSPEPIAPVAQDAPEDEASPEPELQSARSLDYLARIRAEEEDVPEEPIRPREPTMGTMSDEDAALLSGSTGQYRLSRNTASVMQKSKPRAEDPEDFVRRQRVSRTAGGAGHSYYDDEDETPRPTRRRRA